MLDWAACGDRTEMGVEENGMIFGAGSQPFRFPKNAVMPRPSAASLAATAAADADQHF